MWKNLSSAAVVIGALRFNLNPTVDSWDIPPNQVNAMTQNWTYQKQYAISFGGKHEYCFGKVCLDSLQ